MSHLRLRSERRLDIRRAPGREIGVFRGQSEEWALSSSAMRDGALKAYAIGTWASLDPKNIESQVRHEIEAVTGFARACIRAGLPLPEDSHRLRSETLRAAVFSKSKIDRATRQGVDAPFPLLRSLFALAQHHGVPTRLPDWSARADVAAYFACESVARWQADPDRFKPQKTPTDRLAVWALRSANVFDHMKLFREATMSDYRKRGTTGFEPLLEMVEAPYRDNPRLAAQKGCFTLVVYKSPRRPDDFKLPPVDDVLRNYELERVKYGAGKADWPFARCLTLPHSEARPLLRLLGEANVNASTVYPEYDRARVAVEERRFWI